MSDLIELSAEPRSDLGKGASRRLRKTGMVPAVIYGGDSDPASITLTHNEFIHLLENETTYSQVIKLKVGKKKEDVILRDLQRHPFKNQVLHADFYRIDQKTILTVSLPLHLLNEEACYGVKTEGGILNRLVTEIEVACLPKDLPEYLVLDVADLHLGDSLHLSDIKMPKDVELLALSHHDEDEDEHEYDIGVVAVSKMREEKDEDEDADTEGTEADITDEDSEESPED
jgi:large subunit ribosomal protein L25